MMVRKGNKVNSTGNYRKDVAKYDKKGIKRWARLVDVS